jgi:hypothetical protein
MVPHANDVPFIFYYLLSLLQKPSKHLEKWERTLPRRWERNDLVLPVMTLCYGTVLNG